MRLCAGGIERGFSSFSVDKAPAQKYAKSNMLFEAQMGLVDRGADISWLSQYPEESEVLYPPLTAYEVIGEPRTEHGAGRLTTDSHVESTLHNFTCDQW